jgi:hypothetical protein
MPRTVELTVPAGHSDQLLQRLRKHDEVLLGPLLTGASIMSPSDVVSSDSWTPAWAGRCDLSDDVGLRVDRGVSVTSSRPESVASASSPQVDRDHSTSSWEEVQLTVGRESTMTATNLLVMFLAGIFAAIGLHTGALHVIVAAMLVAPAYEPLARFVLELVHRNRSVRDGLVDFAGAYAALAAGAAAVAALASWQGTPLSRESDPASAGTPSSPTGRPSTGPPSWSPQQAASAVACSSWPTGGSLRPASSSRWRSSHRCRSPSWSCRSASPSWRRPILRWSIDVVLVIVGCSGVFVAKRHVDRRLIPGWRTRSRHGADGRRTDAARGTRSAAWLTRTVDG